MSDEARPNFYKGQVLYYEWSIDCHLLVKFREYKARANISTEDLFYEVVEVIKGNEGDHNFFTIGSIKNTSSRFHRFKPYTPYEVAQELQSVIDNEE